jgi:single-strand DNA-binding protein
MAFEITGIVKDIFDRQTFPSGFSKREFVLTTKDNYPQQVKFEMTKERADILDSVSIGEEVKLSFDIRGNEYNGKYFVSLQAWKLEKMGAGAPSDNSPKPLTQVSKFQDNASSAVEDDLPF